MSAHDKAIEAAARVRAALAHEDFDRKSDAQKANALLDMHLIISAYEKAKWETAFKDLAKDRKP